MNNERSASTWNIRRNGVVLEGTYSTNEIAELYADGQLSEMDELWSSEDKQWAKAWHYEGRFIKKSISTPPPIPQNLNNRTQPPTLDENPDWVKNLDNSIGGVDGEIVCPFCWRRFNLEDLKVIAQHEDLTGDTVQTADGEKKRFVPTRFTPDGDAIDAGGMVCTLRACPVCHHNIPMPYFEMEPLFLSLVGSSHSGKSVFLPCMVRTLRRRFRDQFNISFFDSATEQNRWIANYEQLIFQESKLPDKTMIKKGHYRDVRIKDMEVLLTMPAMFGLRDERSVLPQDARRIERTLVIHDNAGEHYDGSHDSAATPGIHHLLHSSAILFLFDPTADSGFRRYYADSSDEQFRDTSYVLDQTRIITNAIQTVMRHDRKVEKKYRRPIIVMFSKADALSDVFGDVLNIEPFVLNNQHESILDMRYLLKVSYSVRELIKRYSPEIINAIESMATDIIYMPVSSLGHIPVAGTVDLEQLSPKWVDVPLLYVLYKLGYLAGEKTLEPDAAQEPKILDRLPGSVSFVHPATNRRDSLPVEYMDVKLRCPFTGVEFMIRGE